jgi:hypothetical protein
MLALDYIDNERGYTIGDVRWWEWIFAIYIGLQPVFRIHVGLFVPLCMFNQVYSNN